MLWSRGKMRIVKRNEKGQVLAFVLVVMIFGAIVIAALFAYLSTSLLVSAKSQENAYALYAADAGVERVIADLLQGIDAEGNPYSVTLNGYTATVVVTEGSGGPPEPSPHKDYIITSIAGVTIKCYARQIPGPDGSGPWEVNIISWQIE